MIGVGVIGLGRSGWELHAEELSIIPGYAIAAVCDQSPQRLARAAERFGARPHSEAQALIEDSEVELVVVAVPGNLHASLAVAALEAGKHVVVEKPMANTVREADEMVAAAERSGRVLTVFHNRRWDPDYRMLKALVVHGELGKLLDLQSRIHSYGPEWATYGVPDFNPSWRIEAAYGGGFLADWGPHMIDQCLDLIGEWPVRVAGELRSHLWSTEVEDHFNMRLGFASGLLATLEGSNNARLPLPRWFVVGSEGTLISEGGFGHWTEMRLRRSRGDMTLDLLPQDIAACEWSRKLDLGSSLRVFQ